MLGGVGVSIFLSQQQTDIRQRAAEISPAPACISDQASCAWDAVLSATTYHYKIIEVGSNAVISEGDVPSSTTKITFTSQANKTYKCVVNAVNSCGIGPEGQATATCSVSPTPTVPAPTPTTPVPTISSCPIPAQVANVRITCPNCAP